MKAKHTIFMLLYSTIFLQAMEPLNLSGELRMLVMVVAFPDRSQEWPVIRNDNPYHPKLGAFPEGILLTDYIREHGPVPVEAWYGTALSHFFTVVSGGMYTAQAIYPKKPDGKPYTTDHPFQYWIEKNGSDTGVVWRYWRKMVNEAANAIYREDSTVFHNIEMVQVNFTGIKPTEYHEIYRGQAIPGSVRFYLDDSTRRTIYNGQVAMLYKPGKLVHEALHLIGRICGSPGGFSGFPDRGASIYDRRLGVNHFNATAGYDVMYNRAHLKAQYALYEQAPMLSHDMLQVGWIRQEELLTINQNDSMGIKLADINYCLTPEQKES
jgi:hypothetical protein